MVYDSGQCKGDGPQAKDSGLDRAESREFCWGSDRMVRTQLAAAVPRRLNFRNKVATSAQDIDIIKI